MKKITWFGAPLAAAAAVALLVQTGAVGDVVHLNETKWKRIIEQNERAAIAQLINSRWQGPIDQIEMACFVQEDTGVYLEIDGERQLSRAQAWTRLQQGEAIEADRMVHELVKLGPLSANERVTVGQLANSLWNGAVQNITRLCYRSKRRTDKFGKRRELIGKVEALETINETQARAIWNSGRGIRPVGIVQ